VVSHTGGSSVAEYPDKPTSQYCHPTATGTVKHPAPPRRAPVKASTEQRVPPPGIWGCPHGPWARRRRTQAAARGIGAKMSVAVLVASQEALIASDRGRARVQKNRCRSGFPNRQNRSGKPVKPTGKPKRAVCYGLLGSVRER
jgi:hypothetical protein